MDRRTFLALISAYGLAPSIAWSQTSPRIRRSATDPAARADLDALSKAVSLMLKNTSSTAPNSWQYWANVHGVPSGISIPLNLGEIWRTCDHGEYFLAWHRLYLIYFESVISALSEKADFAMPYWDWYSSRDIPAAFAIPGDATNPLWRANRGYSKRYRATTAVLEESEYKNFNFHAFGDPHSPIHVNFLGEMSAPATAARDPVFWPHHAAMDRLWEVWRSMKSSHQNPSQGDPWAARQFRFLPESSGLRSVSSILDITELGYGYDNLDVAINEAAEPLPTKPVRIETGRAVTLNAEAVEGTRLLSQKSSTSLYGDALSVRLPIPASAATSLESLGTPQGELLTLRLADVRLTGEGESTGVLYNLYLNLPVRPETQGRVRHRIGQISSFGLRQDGHAHNDHDRRLAIGQTIEFPLSRIVLDLKAAGRWDPNMIEVDFIEPSGTQSTQPLITIGEVDLLTGRP